MTPAEAGRLKAAELAPPPPEVLRRIADMLRPVLTEPARKAAS